MTEAIASALISIDGQAMEVDAIDVSAADRQFRSAWVFAGDAIALDPEKMKPRARQLVNEWRDRKRYEPIVFNGHLFSADKDSVTNVAGAVQMAGIAAMAGQPFSVEWSTHGNEAVTLDGQAITGLGVAIGQRTDDLFVEARSRKAAIDAADTESEIRAILAAIDL